MLHELHLRARPFDVDGDQRHWDGRILAVEIGLGDGSKHVFGPGDARLVEDTTGKGHTTRVLGNQICVTATVPLA